jgi:outer membrane protein TolC
MFSTACSLSKASPWPLLRAVKSLPVCLVLVLLAPLTTATARAERYDLQQLLARVRDRAPQIDAAQAAVYIAEAQVHTARRLWAPTGELTFGLTGVPEVRCADAGGFVDPDKATREANCVRTNVADLQNNSSLRDALPFQGVGLRLDVRLVQPLYTFGKIEAAREAAAAGRAVAGLTVEQARAEVITLATRAYWGRKWALGATATLDEALTKLEGWVGKLERDLDSGKSSFTQIDLLRLKIAVEQVHLVRLEIVKAAEIAQAGLRLLTQDKDAEVDASELTLPSDPARPLQHYELSAELKRPESRMLKAGAQAAHAQRKLRIAEMLPDLGIAGSFTFGYASSVDDPQNAYFNRPNTLSLGVALVLRQTLDFGVRSGRLEQARAEERTALARLRLAQAGLLLEVERAYADAKEARQRSARTGRAERVARSWLLAVDQNLEMGVGESRDLVDAARAYMEMRLRNLQAILDVHTTMVQLQRAAGETP